MKTGRTGSTKLVRMDARVCVCVCVCVTSCQVLGYTPEPASPSFLRTAVSAFRAKGGLSSPEGCVVLSGLLVSLMADEDMWKVDTHTHTHAHTHTRTHTHTHVHPFAALSAVALHTRTQTAESHVATCVCTCVRVCVGNGGRCHLVFAKRGIARICHAMGPSVQSTCHRGCPALTCVLGRAEGGHC